MRYRVHFQQVHNSYEDVTAESIGIAIIRAKKQWRRYTFPIPIQVEEITE